MTVKYDIRIACWISKVTRAHLHREMCNTCFFSTATIVSRTRLIVISTLPLLLVLNL